MFTVSTDKLIWDQSAFSLSGLDILPKLVESINKVGYRMNGDGVITVVPRGDKYLVVTGRTRSIAAVLCGVKDLPVTFLPENANLDIARIKCVTPKVPLKDRLSHEEKLKIAKLIVSKGGTKKDMCKAFGDYMGRKLFKECQ